MAVEILIPLGAFAMMFGTAYLFFTTRNRERMAMIEKGVDSSLFNRHRRKTSLLTIILLNAGIAAVCIGLGIFIAEILHVNLGVHEDAAYPGTIFSMLGIGLYLGFTLTRKLDNEDSANDKESE